MAFISCRRRLIEVLAGAARGKREVRVGEAEWGYRMLIPGDCLDWSTSWYTVSNSRGGIRKFVNDTDGPAFLERDLLPPILNSISTCTSIPTVSWYQHLITSNGLSLFSPLAAPANTLVSLFLQLMRATVLTESSILYFIFTPTLYTMVMSTDLGQVGVVLLPSA